jgi:hypothetical protein
MISGTPISLRSVPSARTAFNQSVYGVSGNIGGHMNELGVARLGRKEREAKSNKSMVFYALLGFMAWNTVLLFMRG